MTRSFIGKRELLMNIDLISVLLFPGREERRGKPLFPAVE
jgi:hypothetical protein